MWASSSVLSSAADGGGLVLIVGVQVAGQLPKRRGKSPGEQVGQAEGYQRERQQKKEREAAELGERFSQRRARNNNAGEQVVVGLVAEEDCFLFALESCWRCPGNPAVLLATHGFGQGQEGLPLLRRGCGFGEERRPEYTARREEERLAAVDRQGRGGCAGGKDLGQHPLPLPQFAGGEDGPAPGRESGPVKGCRRLTAGLVLQVAVGGQLLQPTENSGIQAGADPGRVGMPQEHALAVDAEHRALLADALRRQCLERKPLGLVQGQPS